MDFLELLICLILIITLPLWLPFIICGLILGSPLIWLCYQKDKGNLSKSGNGPLPWDYYD